MEEQKFELTRHIKIIGIIESTIQNGSETWSMTLH